VTVLTINTLTQMVRNSLSIYYYFEELPPRYSFMTGSDGSNEDVIQPRITIKNSDVEKSVIIVSL